MIFLSTDTIVCKFRYRKSSTIQAVKVSDINIVSSRLPEKTSKSLLCYNKKDGFFWSRIVSISDSEPQQTLLFKSSKIGFSKICPISVRILRVAKSDFSVSQEKKQNAVDLSMCIETSGKVKDFNILCKFYQWGKKHNFRYFDFYKKNKNLLTYTFFINGCIIDMHRFLFFNDKEFLYSYFNNISDIYIEYKLLKMNVLVDAFLTSNKFITNQDIIVPKEFVWLFQLKYGKKRNILYKENQNNHFNIHTLLFKKNKEKHGYHKTVNIDTMSKNASPIVIHKDIAVRYLYNA